MPFACVVVQAQTQHPADARQMSLFPLRALLSRLRRSTQQIPGRCLYSLAPTQTTCLCLPLFAVGRGVGHGGGSNGRGGGGSNGGSSSDRGSSGGNSKVDFVLRGAVVVWCLVARGMFITAVGQTDVKQIIYYKL